MIDEYIETVARMLCEAHGLDPDQRVSVGDGQIDTVYEALTRKPSYYGMSYDEPRWKIFRRDASILIASMEVIEGLKKSEIVI